jgi:hypothetical protein
MASTFATFLRRLYTRHQHTYPTVRAFAGALGIDETQLSRAMGPRGKPFDTRRCLKLAAMTGENPTTILRAAGKGDLAILIEQQYGEPSGTLSQDHQELLAAFDAIAPQARPAILLIMQTMAKGHAYRTAHTGIARDPQNHHTTSTTG